jgi:histidinol-phosphate aminotransferase
LQDVLNRNLKLYPDPVSTLLRNKIAARYGFNSDEIFIGNGSDEILKLAFFAFTDMGSNIITNTPSYTLYETIAELVYCNSLKIPLNSDFTLSDDFINNYTDSLKVIANPNSPTGTFTKISQIEKIVQNNNKIVIVDEAYVDFASDTALSLVNKYDNILVVRTFSKSFALAGIRIGYCFGNKIIIEALNKVKDSYNVNRLSMQAAVAAIEDYNYMLDITAKIKENREYLKNELLKLNFYVFESEANFLFVKHKKIAAEIIFKKLKDAGILVRYFNSPNLKDYLRITIGAIDEVNKLISEIKRK